MSNNLIPNNNNKKKSSCRLQNISCRRRSLVIIFESLFQLVDMRKEPGVSATPKV